MTEGREGEGEGEGESEVGDSSFEGGDMMMERRKGAIQDGHGMRREWRGGEERRGYIDLAISLAT